MKPPERNVTSENACHKIRQTHAAPPWCLQKIYALKTSFLLVSALKNKQFNAAGRNANLGCAYAIRLKFKSFLARCPYAKSLAQGKANGKQNPLNT
jgi:hypothetical protein